MLFYEDDVLKVLNEYGEMPKKLLYRLFPDLTETRLKTVISNLKSEHSIMFNGKYISTRSYFPSEDKEELIRHLKTVDALWVLSKYLNRYKDIIHSAAEYPEQIAFVMNRQLYRIMVLYDGDLESLKMLKLSPQSKYIFVVPNISDVINMITPSEKIILCTVSYMEDDIVPEVIFYTNRMEDAHEP